MKLVRVPISIQDANLMVKRLHRHHRPSLSGLFAVACAIEGSDEPCGAAIVGRPVARRLDDGWTVEVVRCVTDGTPNACSFLYRMSQRAAAALGYKRWITYTLPEEGGASLRAIGLEGVPAGGGSWNVPSRPRVDKHPTQTKLRWEADLKNG